MTGVVGCPCGGYDPQPDGPCACGHRWGIHDAFGHCLGVVPYEPPLAGAPQPPATPAE